MEKPTLHAPWRMDYIRSLDKDNGSAGLGCFLCEAVKLTDPAQFPPLQVLWMSRLSIVLMNRYPYANGHLLVAPRAHKAELEDMTDEEGMDLHRQTALAVRLLKRAVSAQGFNVGINLGRCAGAGLPGHVHQHIVPRWSGDINFISVVGDVRVVPQAMDQLYAELVRTRDEMGITPSEA